LEGRPKIAQVSLAGNHWDPRKACRHDADDVAVEVEGVNQVNAVPTKIPSQPKDH
jgi:hypothetical protein